MMSFSQPPYLVLHFLLAPLVISINLAKFEVSSFKNSGYVDWVHTFIK